MTGKLILSDGTTFIGQPFGAKLSTSGEVVFNTGMTGYPESLTDPSYFGQILVLTYPLIGNYGVPAWQMFESRHIQVKALIVQNYIDTPSHYQSRQSLAEWLIKENIPALQGIDTRALTTKLRSQGVMLGQLELTSPVAKIDDPNSTNILPYVSFKRPGTFGQGKKHIILIDCGAKANIFRNLINRHVRVSVVPWDYNPLTHGDNFDGVVVSNGPGDPANATATIETVRALLAQNVPLFGICLGSQILGLAAGAKTYKLKFGHRGHNQPVQQLTTKHAYITSQNHGYALDAKSLSPGWQEWFINLNDGTNEGIRHHKKPFLAVQFHPEAAPGPLDANFLFDDFLSLV